MKDGIMIDADNINMDYFDSHDLFMNDLDLMFVCFFNYIFNYKSLFLFEKVICLRDYKMEDYQENSVLNYYDLKMNVKNCVMPSLTQTIQRFWPILAATFLLKIILSESKNNYCIDCNKQVFNLE